jgi:hypothetical protein
VHLENAVLGKNCYVGSNSNPILLNLTTGTTSPPPPNEPISGHGPTSFEETEEPAIAYLKGSQYVDNSFAAPGASGCVLTLFGFLPISINGLVNTQSGPARSRGNQRDKTGHRFRSLSAAVRLSIKLAFKEGAWRFAAARPRDARSRLPCYSPRE